MLLALFIVPAFLRARPTTRVLFALLAAAVAAVTYAAGNAWPIWQGLHNAMLLGAFLCVLQLLRTIAHAGPAIREVRQRLAPLDPRQVEGGFLVGAFGLGSFLSFGAHAVLAPLLLPEVDERGRREAALASVRGISFAAFWSPFFVGVAYVTLQMQDVPAGTVILLGLAVAVLAVAGDLAAAVAGSGIVCCATMATTPVVRGDWLSPGTHLDLVGAYRPDMREADDRALLRGSLFVDARETTIGEIGELMIPMAAGVIDESAVRGDLYDLAAGAPGRRSDEEITIFKNGGGAHLDLMVAALAYERSRA